MDAHISNGKVELTIERYEELREIERQRDKNAIIRTISNWNSIQDWEYKGADEFIQKAVNSLNSAQSYYKKAKEESADSQKKFWNEQIQQRNFGQRLRFLFNPKSLLVD